MTRARGDAGRHRLGVRDYRGWLPDELAGQQDEAERGARRDKALVAAAGATVAARLVVMLSGVLTIGIAAHALSRPALGIVAVLTTILIFLPFADLGFGTMIMTKLPAAEAHGDLAAMRHVVRAALSALGVIASVFVVGGLIASYTVDWAAALGADGVSRPAASAALAVFFVCGGLAIPATVGARVLVAKQRLAAVRAANAAVAVATIVLTGLCAVLDAPLWGFVLASAGTVSGGALLQTWWVLVRAYPELRPPAQPLGARETWTFVRSGSAYGLLNLSWLIAYCIDSLVVSVVLGSAATAVFAVAVRMFNLVGGTINSAGQQMWSSLADAIARGDLAWARTRFRHSITVAVGLGTVLSLVILAIGKVVARLWVGPHLVPSFGLLAATGAWTVVFLATSQATFLLTAVGRVRMLALTGLLMAAVNLAVSVALTHWIGLPGPALGSIVALALVQVVPLTVATRNQLRSMAAPTAPGAAALAPAG